MLRQARKKHKDIMVQNFSLVDSKKHWESMKVAANMTTKKKSLIADDEQKKAMSWMTFVWDLKHMTFLWNVLIF